MVICQCGRQARSPGWMSVRKKICYTSFFDKIVRQTDKRNFPCFDIIVFYEAFLFNSDLSKWKTENVINMAYLFFRAYAFASDLSKWQTGKVYDMATMFIEARAFNSDLSKWQTSAVSNMDRSTSNEGFTLLLFFSTVHIPLI